MRVGIDLDNTIINYEKVFYDVALEKGLINNKIEKTKTAVKNYIINDSGEDNWTRLQGSVYGDSIVKAPYYDGFLDFLELAKEKNIEVFIVSHKTKYPYLGDRVNLHDSARKWLKFNGFFEKEYLINENVFFRVTKDEKVSKISELSLDFFIDDLSEILLHDSFPSNTKKLHFNFEKHSSLLNFNNWHDISSYIFINDYK